MTRVVEFSGVSKKFRRGDRHDSLRDFVPSLVRGAFGGAPRAQEEEFWALRNVSFEVGRGEAFGIIGPNGAGKSTTLKLLTRILKPTVGSCHVYGRIGALIEVAAGFHPDLTGRENIFLQGAIMGMRQREIVRKLDAIIDFAGVSEFVDTPVKRYSSGMNARLGFSIAAHLEPDVLIIDEVLSVGDMAFQRRCVEKMLEFKRNGVTIVFVSHDLQAVQRLCDRALLLRHAVEKIGRTSEVLDAYLRTSAATPTPPASGNQVRILNAVLSDALGRPVTSVASGTGLCLSAEYVLPPGMRDLHFSFVVHRSTDGLVVYDESVECADLIAIDSGDEHRLRIEFRFVSHLTRGHYHVSLRAYHEGTQRFVAACESAASFAVEEHQTFGGIAHLQLSARAVDSALAEANR